MLSRFATCARPSLPLLRAPHPARRYAATVLASPSTGETATPAPMGHAESKSAARPQLEAMVEQIAGLSLSQTAELVSLLKKRLNIADMAMPMMGAMMPGSAQASAPAEEAPKKEEKKLFNVTLSKFDTNSKAKVIKEIKAMVPNMNLIEAKKFVEGAPKLVKEGITKDEAEKLKSVLEAAGATILIE